MGNKLIHILGLLCCLPVLAGCIREEEYANDPVGNFEQLWKIIDERYCFLEEKGIDWDAVHDTYGKLVKPGISNDNLFDILSEMLYTLKDGHVNLSSASRISYYDAWYQGYPWNYREDILYNYYLGSASSGYRTSAGLKYKIFDNNIGYIRYESFSDGVGEGNLDEVLYYLQICNGLIIDVRDNGGGNLTNSTRIASRFTEEKTLTGYIKHKTGPGHNDFSEMEPIYLEPSNSIRWQKKVVILTNRRCYSATNDFVNAMRSINKDDGNIRDKKIIQIGDRTGGGSGLPFSSELPNGWGVRFSASPHFDKNKNPLENGIEADIYINMDQILEDGIKAGDEESQKKDPLIEEAFRVLNE
ncbi:S41 family peptidase [uncultured Bacteroides sp.]|jgi:Periplasmic protease|uniref:S41 family peptidase n=1 Tax=uncultured Bacteroides sp. TaxID=162156 RepID=UPI00267533E4|nr:S41 family peptidase [uncultured Bacteroides sp.]